MSGDRDSNQSYMQAFRFPAGDNNNNNNSDTDTPSSITDNGANRDARKRERNSLSLYAESVGTPVDTAVAVDDGYGAARQPTVTRPPPRSTSGQMSSAGVVPAPSLLFSPPTLSGLTTQRPSRETDDEKSVNEAEAAAMEHKERETISPQPRGVSFVLRKHEVRHEDSVRPLPLGKGPNHNFSLSLSASSILHGSSRDQKNDSGNAASPSAGKDNLTSPQQHPGHGPYGSIMGRGDANADNSADADGASYVVVDGLRRRRHSLANQDNSTDTNESSTVDRSSPSHGGAAAGRSGGLRYRRGSGGLGERQRTQERESAGGNASPRKGSAPFLVHVVANGATRAADGDDGEEGYEMATREPGNRNGGGVAVPPIAPTPLLYDANGKLPDGCDAPTPLVPPSTTKHQAEGRRRGSRNGRQLDNDPDAVITLDDVLKTGPAPYTAAARVNTGSAGTFTQFLALVERTMQQYWQNKFSMIAEVVVPLVFVALIIVLDVAFGGEKVTQNNPILANDFPFQVNVNDYATYFCYNDSASPIQGLPNCSKYELSQVHCEGDESGLPVKGFCHTNAFPLGTMVVAQYVESLAGPLVALPKLDSIISHQWMAKKIGLAADSRARTAMAALSSVGLGVSSSTRYESITYSGKLLFAPRANIPSDLVDYFNSVSWLFRYTYGGIYDTVAEAEAYAKAHTSDITTNESIWGIIVVNDLTTDFDVQIELHDKALPSLHPTVNVNYRGGFSFDGSDMFLCSGYISLQRTLYDYFLSSRQRSGAILPVFDVDAVYPMITAFPTIATERRYMVDLAGPLIAFILVLSYLYPFSQMTKRVVLEKELRIREAMLIMGLRRASLWLCYFVVSFLQLLITSLLVTILLCATVVTRSNPFVIFLMLLVFSCTLVPLAGLVSTLFSKARLAALLSPLLYFVLSMLIFAMTNAKSSVILGLSIFSPTALAALSSSVMTGEAGSGFGAKDLSGNPLYTPLPYRIMLMLMVDFVLYTLAMLYLDAVVPQEWGSTRHPLFFLIDPYRAIQRKCGNGSNSNSNSNGSGNGNGNGSSNSNSSGSTGKPHSSDCEGEANTGEESQGSNSQTAAADSGTSGKDPNRFDKNVGIDSTTGERKTASIRLEQLHKQYKRSGTRFTAVDKLSWELFPGEISVLLGPNGSGKSTTINMMTGMLVPDKGDCVIAGHSIRDDVNAARHEIGFCPQHNILWPDLTCRQHLEFFGKIKGLCGAELEDAVTDVLRAVDLEEKIGHTPAMLSGGQKRKLSVAIAFVGRNRIVLLDEPTSGMDVAARRHTWSLLRAMAPNHTILLTTHYMDEADLLGDQIAIVSEGVMQCAGSSLFLRSHAGSGYTLRFDLLPLAPGAADSFLGTRAAQLKRKWDGVSSGVLRHIPEATMTLQTSDEMEFCIPLCYERRLPSLLQELEQRGNQAMGIRSYSLSAPTMEDVFMNIVEAAHAEKERERSAAKPASPGRPSLAPAKSLASTNTQGGETPDTTMATPATAPVEVTAAASPLYLRRMSRASVRFISGEDSRASVDDAVLAFREPDAADNAGCAAEGTDDGEDDPQSWAAAMASPLPFHGFDDEEVFGHQVESPRNHASPTAENSSGSARKAAMRHASIQNPPAAAATLPVVLPCGDDASVINPLPSWPPPSVYAAGTAVEAAHQPMKDLAAKADQHVDEIWRVLPVESTTRFYTLQLEAMLFKRFFYSLRDRRMQFFQIICPVVCILLAMLLQLVNVQFKGTIVMDAADLFDGRTQMELSLCSGVLGSSPVIDTLFPPSAKDAVLFDDKNFIYSGDLADYMLDTWYVHPEARYAAVQCQDSFVASMLKTYYPREVAGKSPYVVMYNTSSKESLPFALSAMYRLAYYNSLYLSGNPFDLITSTTFRISAKALPVDDETKKSDSALASILIGVIVLIPFTFLPANPVAWVVKERETHARHLQKLSGLPYLLYWVGNFIFDFAAYLLSMFLVITVFAIFRRWEYVGDATIGATIVSFLLYGLCCCTGSYAISFFFSEHTTAQVVVMGVSFLSGFVCVVLVFILSMMDRTKEASDIMRWIFRLLPTYSVGEVILNLALLEQNQLREPELRPWSMPTTGWADVYMAVEVPVFIAATLLCDHPNSRAVLQTIKEFFCCSRGKEAARCAQLSNSNNDSNTNTNTNANANSSSNSNDARGSPVVPATEANTEPRLDASSVATAASPKLRARQQRAAEAEERCRVDTVTRRQSVRLYPITDPAAGERSGFEPMTEQEPGVLQQATGQPPYGAANSLPSSHPPSPGSPLPPRAAPTSANRVRVVTVPSLAVADLTARRQSCGGNGSADPAKPEEAAATPGVVVSIPAVSSPANARGRAAATAREEVAPALSYMYPAPALEEDDYINKEEEDSDVEDERLAVYQDEKALASLDVVRLVDLRKVYSNGKVAVRGLSFGIMPGEVFGFLGTNGAGKSTALSILTQEQLPTSGRAYVCDHDVVRDSASAMRCIGYCPQFDACFDLLTVEEHLTFYSRIRGIERQKRKELVANLMDLCGLVMYRDVLSHELSGGNRRKLSVAIALLGAPRVVCLDEPSAGMDPIARRVLWRALDRVSKKCSIVLTTHHLEEVEALADTVAIMVDGGLRCIGDLTHLKHKYARNAYELSLRVGGGKREGGVKEEGGAGGDDRLPPLAGSWRASASANGNDDSRRRSVRGRSQSITYGGADFMDTEDGVVQFMATYLPSALLVENFNDERYVYSIPATRDVAKAMAALQEHLQRRRSSNGTLLGTTLSRNAMLPSFYESRGGGGGGQSATARAKAKIVRLSEVFRLLQEHQERLGITEYSVSQVSLEQVFLRVAHYEEDSHITTAVSPGVGGGNRINSSAASPLPRTSVNNLRGGERRRNSLSFNSDFPQSPLPRGRSNSLYHVLNTHARGASLSMNTPYSAGATTNVQSFHGTYAQFRRARALARRAALEAENERQINSEPDRG